MISKTAAEFALLVLIYGGFDIRLRQVLREHLLIRDAPDSHFLFYTHFNYRDLDSTFSLFIFRFIFNADKCTLTLSFLVIPFNDAQLEQAILY